MKKLICLGALALLLPALAGCSVRLVTPAAVMQQAVTPTANPAIYNQVPKTKVYGPGECTATLTAPAPAFTSNTLGGPPSGEIPAGTYEVGVVADYGSISFYALNNVGPVNYINSTSVASLSGACAAGASNPLVGVEWQVILLKQP